MQTLALFGAGASYGSIDVSPFPPPLGRNMGQIPGLFSRMEGTSESVRRMTEDLKQVFRRDFEEGMERYYSQLEMNCWPFLKDICKYLAQFEIGSGNIYLQVLETLLPHNTIFCSLNYDLLLEQAASRWANSVYYDAAERPSSINVLKLHGSINFMPPSILRGRNVFMNVKDIYSGDVEILSPEETRQRLTDTDQLSPSIAVYMPGKPYIVSADIVHDQMSSYKMLVETVRRIIIMGVFLNERDHHIWAPLAKTNAQIIYCGLDADKARFDDWRQRHNRNRDEFVLGDFERAASAVQSFLTD